MASSSDFDNKVVMAGVLYWPIYLEMQRRRLQTLVKKQVVSLLPDIDFVGIMKSLGLSVQEEALATLRHFDEPEELVSRHGSRLWYWVRDFEGTSQLLLVCLLDKQKAEAMEVLVVDMEDRWYVEDAAYRLNKAVETYSIDVLHRVVQHWVFLHDGLKPAPWKPFTEIREALKDLVEMLKASKKDEASPSPANSDSSNIETTSSDSTLLSIGIPANVDELVAENAFIQEEPDEEETALDSLSVSETEEAFDFVQSPIASSDLQADSSDKADGMGSGSELDVENDDAVANLSVSESNELNSEEDLFVAVPENVEANDRADDKPASSQAGRDDDSVSANAVPIGTPVVIKKKKSVW